MMQDESLLNYGDKFAPTFTEIELMTQSLGIFGTYIKKVSKGKRDDATEMKNRCLFGTWMEI